MGHSWAFINNIRVAPQPRDIFGKEIDQRGGKTTNFHPKAVNNLSTRTIVANDSKTNIYFTSSIKLVQLVHLPVIDLLPDDQGYMGLPQNGMPLIPGVFATRG